MDQGDRKVLVIVIFLILLAGFTYFYAHPLAKDKKTLKIYVPCGMTLPFQELIKAYEANHPAIHLEATFDNTNVLVKLITNKGKQPDLFISPGEKEIGILEEQGVIQAGSKRPFGKYELILIVPANSHHVFGPADLSQKSVKTIALANPDFNSVGAYALASLKSLGYWEQVKNKVFFTNTPIEALSFVATAKADASIHYNACPFETDSTKVAPGAIKIVVALPANSYGEISNYIAILQDSQNKKTAENFINFMFTNKGKKILSKYGLDGLKPAPPAALAKEGVKITLEAYYPFNEEHLVIKEYLFSLPDKYGGRVKVDCIDFRSDQGYTRWRKSGLSCGGILINGKSKFNIQVAGQSKEVEFLKGLDLYWTKEELEAAIDQELLAVNKH
jgi:molybdate transport system substrate-binding protein